MKLNRQSHSHTGNGDQNHVQLNEYAIQIEVGKWVREKKMH